MASASQTGFTAFTGHATNASLSITLSIPAGPTIRSAEGVPLTTGGGQKIRLRKMIWSVLVAPATTVAVKLSWNAANGTFPFTYRAVTAAQMGSTELDFGGEGALITPGSSISATMVTAADATVGNTATNHEFAAIYDLF